MFLKVLSEEGDEKSINCCRKEGEKTKKGGSGGKEGSSSKRKVALSLFLCLFWDAGKLGPFEDSEVGDKRVKAMCERGADRGEDLEALKRGQFRILLLINKLR